MVLAMFAMLALRFQQGPVRELPLSAPSTQTRINQTRISTRLEFPCRVIEAPRFEVYTNIRTPYSICSRVHSVIMSCIAMATPLLVLGPQDR